MMKWIFFAKTEPDLTGAFNTLRATKLLEKVNLFIEEDGAPMSSQAKAV